MTPPRTPTIAKVPDVTVVLPCYNERDHVELEVKRIRAALEAAGMSYELLCIDDGSTDGTREVLQGIEGIRTILLPRNQGSGILCNVIPSSSPPRAGLFGATI